MKNYKLKICKVCGEKFISTGNSQKYCSNCKVEGERQRKKQYYQNNKERMSAQHKEYYQINKEEINIRHKQWFQEYPEYQKECVARWRKNNLERTKELGRMSDKKRYLEKHKYNKQWFLNHSEKMREYHKQWKEKNWEKYLESERKTYNKRSRNFDFIPLNEYFEGAEAHHIDRVYIIYIPKELHKSIYHSVLKDINMDTINALAFNYLKC